jgi:integrase/recombinase XerC
VSSTEFGPFLDFLTVEKRYSSHTCLAYQTDLTQFHFFLATEHDGLPFSEVNYQIVRSWIAGLMEQGISPRSVNRKITTLRTFFRFLIKEGEIRINPMQKIQGPKTSKRLPVFVEEKQMDNLLDSRAFEMESSPYEASLIRSIIELLYGTGMRLSELVDLKSSGVDTARNTIKVLGKRNKERIIPITAELKGRLEDYTKKKNELANLSENDAFFFLQKDGKKITRKFVYTKVKNYLSQVTTIDKKSPHVLRHTFATHMLNNGADLNAIKELLGHANLSATQVYTHNTVEKLKAVHHKSHPRA